MSHEKIDTLLNKVLLSNLCIEQLKKVVAETEKINDQPIHTSFKEVYSSITAFKIELDHLRVKLLHDYPKEKDGKTGDEVDR